MREIKFRFWSPDGIMLADHEGWTEGVGINEALSCSREYGYVAMQFTGLLDRNGKEIFESDLLSTPGDPGVWEVRFIDASFWFVVPSAPTNRFTYDWAKDSGYWDGQYEVVGNIYENPALLDS